MSFCKHLVLGRKSRYKRSDALHYVIQMCQLSQDVQKLLLLSCLTIQFFTNGTISHNIFNTLHFAPDLSTRNEALVPLGLSSVSEDFASLVSVM